MEEDMEFMNFTDSVEEVMSSQKFSGDSELVMPRPLSMGRRPVSVVNDASFSRGCGDSVRTVTVNVHNTHLKMSVIHGDITTLKQVECIVNSTNPRIYGLGGVCGAICRAAGPGLKSEIKAKYPKGCARYEAKMTNAHNLTHLKTIIHTVGPAGSVKIPRSQSSQNALKTLAKEQLETCYKNVLDLANDSQIKSIGIPCIATGALGFNKKQAALIAIKTVDKWLLANFEGCVEKVVFCCYLPEDKEFYSKFLEKLKFKNEAKVALMEAEDEFEASPENSQEIVLPVGAFKMD